MAGKRFAISPIDEVLAGGPLPVKDVVRVLARHGPFRGVVARPKATPSQWMPRSWSTGIYVLDTGDGYMYVGQSTEVHARVNSHRKTWPTLRAVGFLPCRRTELDEVERAVARAIDSKGIPLWNRTLIDLLHVDTPFDQVFPRTVHERWLTDLAWNEWSGPRVTEDQLRHRYQGAFDAFASTPQAESVERALRRVVALTVPAPRRTEITYWSVSCAKPDKDGPFTRLNVGLQATFDAYGTAAPGGVRFCLWIPVILAEQALGAEFREGRRGELGTARLTAIGKQCGFFRSSLTAAGPNQIGLVVFDEATLDELLQTEDFIRGMRRIHLGLMQRGKNLNRRSHCMALADRLLGEADQPTNGTKRPSRSDGASTASAPVEKPRPAASGTKPPAARATARAYTALERRTLECLPSGPAGKAAAERLHHSIEHAKRVAPTRWGLSVRDGFLRLNVGMIEVMTVAPTGVRLLVLSPQIPATVRRDKRVLVQESNPDPNAGVYRSVYQSAVVAIPSSHADLGALLAETLAAAHTALMSRAAATRMNPMTRRAHAQAAVDLIDEVAHA